MDFKDILIGSIALKNGFILKTKIYPFQSIFNEISKYFRLWLRFGGKR